MRRLIVEPLEKSGASTVIAIDALDECGDQKIVGEILSALGKFIPRIPNVKFFITSRPELHIEQKFYPLKEAGYVTEFALDKVEACEVNRDIRRFLEEKLGVLALDLDAGHLPTEQDLGLLCEHAAGVFAHAVAMVKFLNSGGDFRRLLQKATEGSPGICQICGAWADK